MRNPCALVAADPLNFGRAAASPAYSVNEPRWTVSDELKLFGTAFAAGFLFVSILIA